jgi:MarR family 2-MHQ and catechol resistance regulon transcriptional repressor
MPLHPSLPEKTIVTKRYRGMAGDARALSTYVKLLRAGEHVLREATRPLALYDLTPSQFGVLEALHHTGPQCLSSLARRILKTSGNLTLVVRNLEKRGLVHRKPGRGDRRFTTIALTPKGRKLIRTIFPGHAASIVGVMSRLSAREQESLAALCGKLGGESRR